MEYSKVEIEYNINWIRKYPDIFAKSLSKWHNKCLKEGLEEFGMCDNGNGTITYVARQK